MHACTRTMRHEARRRGKDRSTGRNCPAQQPSHRLRLRPQLTVVFSQTVHKISALYHLTVGLRLNALTQAYCTQIVHRSNDQVTFASCKYLAASSTAMRPKSQVATATASPPIHPYIHRVGMNGLLEAEAQTGVQCMREQPSPPRRCRQRPGECEGIMERESRHVVVVSAHHRRNHISGNRSMKRRE